MPKCVQLLCLMIALAPSSPSLADQANDDSCTVLARDGARKFRVEGRLRLGSQVWVERRVVELVDLDP